MNKYLSILRPLNGLISMFGVFTGFAIAQQTLLLSAELGMAMIAAFLITGAGNVINDYYDIEIDKKLNNALQNTKDKNLLFYSGILFATGIIISGLINVHALIIAIVVSVLLIVYSAIMQKYKFLGNWVVALGTALTLIYGATLVQVYDAVIILAGSAMLANAAREIIKDAEDMKGDFGSKTTLPMLLEFGTVKIIIILLYFLAIILGVMAWVFGYMNGPYYILLLLAAAFMFFNSWKLFSEKKFKPAQWYSKFGMITALLAFLGGIL
ncbi:MAG: UbiA family prenyltransferase [archaeon]|nr:UbiA family prenyltransferase [archaeon]